MKSIRYALCAFFALTSVTILHGDTREIRIKSSKNFNKVLNRHPLVVALFYQNDKTTHKDKELKQKIESLERMFNRVSGGIRYRDAHMVFARINVVGDDLEGLAMDYDVSTLPAFLLFRDGRVIHGAQQVGFVRDAALQSFIDEHVGDTINAYVQSKAERMRRRERNRRTYTYVGYGVGAPYYGGYYGSPYYGGSVGFGFGF